MNFKDTNFKKFLDKAGAAITKNGGDIVNIGLKAATGNISGAIEETVNLLKGDDDTLSKELLSELELKRQEFELEKFRLEVEDRNSAREREVELKKAGGQDIMMVVSGVVGLTAFMLVLVSVLFFNLPVENKNLIYHSLGIVEGVAISIFAYYFGSSKGSSDKHKELMKKGN